MFRLTKTSFSASQAFFLKNLATVCEAAIAPTQFQSPTVAAPPPPAPAAVTNKKQLSSTVAASATPVVELNPVITELFKSVPLGSSEQEQQQQAKKSATSRKSSSSTAVKKMTNVKSILANTQKTNVAAPLKKKSPKRKTKVIN